MKGNPCRLGREHRQSRWIAGLLGASACLLALVVITGQPADFPAGPGCTEA